MTGPAPSPWMVIAGGGTAGHVLPALAIADTLVSRGVDAQSIAFIGSERGVEKRLVPAAGYRLTMLSGRGLLRSFAPRALWQNAKAISGLVGATARTIASFRRHRPAIVLSVGGYASVPASVAAQVCRVPLVLAESNARAGRSVKVFSRYAKAAAVAFPGTGLERAVLTGNPVRREILELAAVEPGVARRDARLELGIDASVFVLTIFGGSLGARRINEAVIDLCELWSDRLMLVRHVVGERDLSWATDRRNKWLSAHPNAALRYEQVAYEDRMPLWYVSSDLVICRAGATSIADLAATGTPAILIPLPSAAEDHQTINARAVASDNAAIVLADAEVSGERLAHEVGALIDAPNRRTEMATAQRRRAQVNAGDAIADLVMLHASRPPSLLRSS